MENSNEAFYYELTRKEQFWETSDMRQVLEFIKRKLPGGRGRVLEIGCGIATIVPYLPPQAEYTGIEVSDLALATARREHPSANITFIKASADALPFASASFDVVLAFNVIEHCRQPTRVLEEALRVLKDGGGGVLTGPNLDLPISLPNGIRHRSFLYKLYFRAVRLLDYCGRILGYLRFRTIAENFTEATGRFEKPDDDLRYVCSAYEVIHYIKRRGGQIVYTTPFPRDQGWKHAVKRFLTKFPGMVYYGRALGCMFEYHRP